MLTIAGPTATGKSLLAVRLAEQLDGLLINADSMQIYSELRILTARPDYETEARIPHKLYGVLSAKEKFSVGIWRTMAEREINQAWKARRLPILVGGTGLYFKALLEGISEIPDVDIGIRQEVRKFHDRVGSKKFYQELAKVDLVSAARLSENDTQRLTRAYEVYLATGKPLSEWHRISPPIPGISADIQSIILAPPRSQLYAACDRRFNTMLEQGALNEVCDLMNLKLPTSQPVMKVLGVPELSAFLRGEISLEIAIANAKRATRRYAKRQTSWFRNQFGKSEHINTQYSESLFDKIFSKIRFGC